VVRIIRPNGKSFLSREFRMLINQPISILKIISLLGIAVAFYWQDLVAVFTTSLANSEFSYFLAVPVLFSYMVYRKRKVLQAIIANQYLSMESRTNKIPLAFGILLFGAAISAHFYGPYNFSPLEIQMASFPLFITALILVFFNFRTVRELAFPLAFLIFLIPPPTTILYSIGSTLSEISAHASVALVNAFGMHSQIISNATSPIVQMTRPDSTTVSFVIDVTCSGIYSLITFTIITVFLAYLIRDKLWKKVAIITAGLPIIYALNILRISIMLAIGYNYGEEIAQSLFHQVSGLALTAVGAVIIALFAQKLLKANFYKKQTPQPCQKCANLNMNLQSYCQNCGRYLKTTETKISIKDLAKIVAVVALIGLLLFVQPPIQALAKGPVGILGELVHSQNAPSTNLLPQIDNYTLNFEFRDTEWETLYNQDGTLTYSYTPTSDANPKVWVLIEIAHSGSTFHRWETCLISYPLSQGSQAPATQIDMRDVKLTENPPITARHFVFHWTRYDFTQAVCYWRETLTLTTNTTSERSNVQISLIIYPNSTQPDEIQQVEATLQTFGENVANYWEPLKTWVPIALLLSQNANILATIFTAGLILLIPVAALKQIQKQGSRKNIYFKLSDQDKKIYNSLKQTQKNILPTTKNIQNAYQTVYQENIEENLLIEKLTQLAEDGMIMETIKKVDDEPVKVWVTYTNDKFK
jgi:exosortase